MLRVEFPDLAILSQPRAVGKTAFRYRFVTGRWATHHGLPNRWEAHLALGIGRSLGLVLPVSTDVH